MADGPEDQTTSPRAWLVTAFGEDRQYAGNIGYQDDIQRAYRYDSFVPNCKQIRLGDLLVLRDKASVLGVARILEIELMPGVKRQQLCPECFRTGLKERATMQPRFRCHFCKTAFDEPRIREAGVTNYVAHFDGAFEKTNVKADATEFRSACPKYNGQHAMQVIELDRLGALGAPLRAAATRVFGLDASQLLATTAGEPTADPAELNRRVRRLREQGPLGKPTGQAKPKKVIISNCTYYSRDPKVVVWILQNAKGICEACRQQGPFKNCEGEHFLEVHHVVHLAEDGPDTVENAAALCPNCHRAMHLAPDRHERRELLRKLSATHATAHY